MFPEKLMDYHLHTAVTIDGRMSESDACERAISMGIYEIAFTNHLMLTQPDYTISPAALLDHWEKIQDCREHFPQLAIRLGIEMDYYPNRELEITDTLEYYAKFIGGYFDIILGSVHDISGAFFSNKNLAPAFFKDRDLALLYRDYFELASKAAKSRLFDVIAHPDLIKKYTNQLTPHLPYELYSKYADKFIDALVENDVGLEINTKGLKLPVNEAYPSSDLLNAYLTKVRQSNKEPIISLGSDAHNVDGVGFKILETTQKLKCTGLTTLMCFDKRIKSPFTI